MFKAMQFKSGWQFHDALVWKTFKVADIFEKLHYAFFLLFIKSFEIALVAFFRDGQEEATFRGLYRFLSEFIKEQRTISKAISRVILLSLHVLALACKLILFNLKFLTHPDLLIKAF